MGRAAALLEEHYAMIKAEFEAIGETEGKDQFEGLSVRRARALRSASGR